MKGNAVLFSEMTPPIGAENQFNDWYDNHHMPSHVYGVPGFESGQRYKVPGASDYLAIYDLNSPDTLTDEEYRTRKYTPDAPTKAMLSNVTAFTRYIGEEIGFQLGEGMSIEQGLDAAVVLGVFFIVPETAVSEFVEWYEVEHSPILLKNAEWRLARHMKIADADPKPFTHMVLHYVDSEAVFQCEELAEAKGTEWRNRLAKEEWFRPHVVHYRRYGKRYHKGETDAAAFTLNI